MNEAISAADNSASATVDNPIGTDASVVETSANGGQAQEAAPTELFQGVDPNKLPPQAKVFYDQMLKDYREKTGKLSETIKSEIARATESFKSKAELYDQIASQEPFVSKWNAYVQELNSQQSDPKSQEDPILQEMKTQLQQMNEKIQLSEMSQITEGFAEAINEKGEKLHPDFDALNEINVGQLQNGDKAEPFSLLRATIELAQGNSPQEKLANGYKAAKAVHDAIFEKGKKAGMGRIQTKLSNSTQPASHSVGDVMSVTEKKPKNAAEALALAKKGIMVSRD